MSDKFTYISHVSDEEFEAAVKAMEDAIAKKDTPKEWAAFTGRLLLTVGKMAIAQFGFGPAIVLVEEIFGADAEIITNVLKMLGDSNEAS